MSLWFILLLTLFAVGESQSTAAFNQTDVQTAMYDMRSRSYYGFVILLKILNSLPNQLQSNDLTFLMPNDEDLSHFSITTNELHDFLLSHYSNSIATQSSITFSKWLYSSFWPSKQGDQHNQQWQSRFFCQQCKDCHTKCVPKLSNKVSWNQCFYDI
jgi:hypothetical protein